MHRGKRRTWKWNALLWLITFAFVGVLLMIVYTLAGAENMAAILGDKTYWLSLGVACGILLAGYLMVYRIDAQNIALNENDLEDTDWLTPKRLRKLKEFTVTDWDKLPEKKDGIVIGAEKRGKNVEIVTTDQLHALIVGTTGSGKTTGFVDQNIAVGSEHSGIVALQDKAEPRDNRPEKGAVRKARRAAGERRVQNFGSGLA